MGGIARWIPGRFGSLPVLLRAPGHDDVELRRGIERVLHDDVAIGLSAMVIQLDLISAEAGDDSELAAWIGAVRLVTCQVVEEVRRLGGVVYPPVLRGAGLGPALRAVAEHVGLRLRLDLPAGDLDAEARSRVGLLVTDRLRSLCPGTEVRVRVRGRRFVRVRITEKQPEQRRRYWAVAKCG